MTETPLLALHEHGREFFEVLGRCIAAWAAVDDELFRIFRDCVGPTEQSAIIFYRVPGLDGRIQLTDELVLSVLPKTQRKSGGHDHPNVKAWRKLVSSSKKLLLTRRRLAHHPVNITHSQYFGFAETVGAMSFGGAPFYNGQSLKPNIKVHVSDHERHREKSKNDPELTITDLKGHLFLVRTIANDLNKFSRDVLTPLREEAALTSREQHL